MVLTAAVQMNRVNICSRCARKSICCRYNPVAIRNDEFCSEKAQRRHAAKVTRVHCTPECEVAGAQCQTGNITSSDADKLGN